MQKDTPETLYQFGPEKKVISPPYLGRLSKWGNLFGLSERLKPYLCYYWIEIEFIIMYLLYTLFWDLHVIFSRITKKHRGDFPQNKLRLLNQKKSLSI